MYAFMFSPNAFFMEPHLPLRPPLDCRINHRTRAEHRLSENAAHAVWGRNLSVPCGGRRAVHAWQPGCLVGSRLAFTSVRTDDTPGHFDFYFDFTHCLRPVPTAASGALLGAWPSSVAGAPPVFCTSPRSAVGLALRHESVSCSLSGDSPAELPDRWFASLARTVERRPCHDH